MPTTNQLTDDVTWLTDCENIEGDHLHHSQYLITSGGSTVLVEAGGELAQISRVIEERGKSLDAILLTHCILPHVKHVEALQETWPDVKIITPVRAPARVGLPAESAPTLINETSDVAGLTFTFLDPLLTDIVGSNWVYNHETRILFTSEGVGNYHSDGACESVYADQTVDFGGVHQFNVDRLPWLQYIDPEKLQRGWDAIVSELDIEYVAPIHGNPIHKTALDDYFAELRRSIAEFPELITIESLS